MKYIIFIFLMPIFFVIACTDQSNMSDLKVKLANIKKDVDQNEKNVQVDSSLTLKPIVYHKNNLKSTKIDPDKNDDGLLAYPVNDLKVQGIVYEDKEKYAFILTPDGKIYQVAIGDKLGSEESEIVAINYDQIEVKQGTNIIKLMIKE